MPWPEGYTSRKGVYGLWRNAVIDSPAGLKATG
jgi:hypothetical protein